MAAEHLDIAPAALPLLLEPLAPDPKARRSTGWLFQDERRGQRRVIRRVPVRDHSSDAYGALIQHTICRYLVQGVSRQQLAAETSYSERQIQDCLGGRVCRPYALPILVALKRLGLGFGHGQRQVTGTSRLTEIIAAQTALLERADGLLAYLALPEATELRQALRLLLAGREPLGGRVP